ncbi:hypothetical protein Cgig2_011585 [Carnegiea gigantea]|uniref:Uncharacterized protein n=1 Tax=Carnegiea gigantea TaxID=171969 RepID=A0A9Q1QDG6_9CARY|nr:hypothetical protein Cgig2_011585 [Carnegiea gigantea]
MCLVDSISISGVACERDLFKGPLQDFKLKSRSQVVSLGGGVRPKDIRGPYYTRAELKVELNATGKKHEVLTYHLAIVEAENEKLLNCAKSVKTKMMKINDLVFEQFNTYWFGFKVRKDLDNIRFYCVMILEDVGSLFQVLAIFHHLFTKCEMISAICNITYEDSTVALTLPSSVVIIPRQLISMFLSKSGPIPRAASHA